MKMQSQKMRIRPMVSTDIAHVIAIEKAAYDPGWSPENFLSEIERSCGYAYVAAEDGRLIGYIIFWVICSEAHLLNLSVHPVCRKRGIGRTLLTFLIDFCLRQRVRWINLEVRRSNEAALNLYQSLGFREVGVRKAYYPGSREDGVLMQREFGCETK